MGKLIIYALIVFIATASGSSTGLGGGVVIKPLFDIVSSAPTATINFYSSLAVFIMAIVSLIKQLKQKFKFNFKSLLTISFGAIIGGFIGQKLLTFVVHSMAANHVKVLQSAMLFVMLVTVLIYSFIKNKLISFHLTNILLIFIVGVGLGTFSVFLGIGGGPINVALTMLLFSFSLREAAVYSVGIIFFAQLTKMVTITFSAVKPSINLMVMIAVIIAAIIGGFVGTWINRHASCKLLDGIYNILLSALVCVTLFNTLHYAGII
ncbi:sulfite exporter TauE/SafE family protein [Ligilactobacillus cholophilus]|uniref:sulfite exporter TauE/SafE family protein n=1 Tax=Ligilactobacillus cholophilus TaxID=3050131 RepID=UPI0025AEF290|nr:sulfite exporter TauE/SafE family protein [Ligilactobacillus cholophilus]